MRMDRRFWTIVAVFTALQVAMVVAGHYSPAIAQWFAVGGMGLSLLAGLAVGWKRGDSLVAAGGQRRRGRRRLRPHRHRRLAGARRRRADAAGASGTLSSAVAGAIGGARRPACSAGERPPCDGLSGRS